MSSSQAHMSQDTLRNTFSVLFWYFIYCVVFQMDYFNTSPVKPTCFSLKLLSPIMFDPLRIFTDYCAQLSITSYWVTFKVLNAFLSSVDCAATLFHGKSGTACRIQIIKLASWQNHWSQNQSVNSLCFIYRTEQVLGQNDKTSQRYSL